MFLLVNRIRLGIRQQSADMKSKMNFNIGNEKNKKPVVFSNCYGI